MCLWNDTFLQFVAVNLAPHVFAWVEKIVVIVLISFLYKFKVVFFHATCFFFLSCYTRLERAVGGEEPSPLLSYAYHFRSNSVFSLKQPRKGQQIFCCLFFLSVFVFLLCLLSLILVLPLCFLFPLLFFRLLLLLFFLLPLLLFLLPLLLLVFHSRSRSRSCPRPPCSPSQVLSSELLNHTSKRNPLRYLSSHFSGQLSPPPTALSYLIFPLPHKRLLDTDQLGDVCFQAGPNVFQGRETELSVIPWGGRKRWKYLILAQTPGRGLGRGERN